MLYAKMSNFELGIALRFIFGNLASVLIDGVDGLGPAGLDGAPGKIVEDGFETVGFPEPLPFPPPLFLLVPPIPVFNPPLPLLLVQLSKASNDIASSINFLFFFIIILSFKEFLY